MHIEDENLFDPLRKPRNGVFNAVAIIDVNGEKHGPNVIGRDIYPVWVLTSGLYPNPLPEKYYANTSAKDIEYFLGIMHADEKCTKNSTGSTCPKWFLTHSSFDKD